MIAPLSGLRALIRENKLDTVLISSVPNIIYLTNYSGFSKDEREAYLFITRKEQYILTDGRYATAAKTLIPDFKLIEISSKNSVKEILKKLAAKHKTNKVGFEGHNITHLEHESLTKTLGKISHIDLRSFRMIKTPDEISKIEDACQLGDKAFEYILKQIKLGVSEKEIANKIEIFIKEHGADISFSPIVAFGGNSSTPHHQVTNNKLTNNQIVLLDFGVKLNNYCSDMTRTVFFGKASAEFKKMYHTVLNAQQKAIDFLTSSFKSPASATKVMKASDIDSIAREHIISSGYETIPHSLGHGIGLEVHEAPSLSPKSKDILKEGMVFSVEPGIYLPASPQGGPNFGGVRIEDLVILEKNGLRLLTHSQKELIEI